MKTIVIYNSQTGFTKRYAEWIAEETGAACLELSAAKKKDLSEYEAIVFGGWALAGSISKLSWFKKNMDQWENKRLIAFCVGASPSDNPEIEQFFNQIFDKELRKKVDVFYCPGGINYKAMPIASKLLMKMFANMVKSQKNQTEAERKMAEMLASSYDISDKKYIEPILQCLQK